MSARPATPQTRNGHPWGVTYVGSALLEPVIEAIGRTCRREGLTSERSTLGRDVVRLRSVQAKKPWYRVLATAAPQRIEWNLRVADDRLVITCDFRLFRWYAILLAVGGSLIAAAFAVSLLALELAAPEAREEVGLATAPVFLSALLFTLPFVWLLGALGGGRAVAAFWQPIAHQVERKGGSLDPVGRTVSRRYSVAMLVFSGLWLSVVGWPAWNGLREFLTFSGVGLWGPLALLLVMVAIVVFLHRRRDAMLRAEALLGGLVSSGTMLLYLAVPLPLVTFGSELGTFRESTPGLAEVRQWCWLMIGTSAVIAIFAIGLGLLGIFLSLQAWLPLWRMQTQREKQPAKSALEDAISEGESVKHVRWLFTAAWVCWASLLAIGLVGVVFSAWGAAVPTPTAAGLQLPRLSADILALALGRPLEDRWIDIATRCAWLLYGGSALALWWISVGQLLRQRRSIRRRLQSQAALGHDQRAEIEMIVDVLRDRANLGPVRAAISGESTPEAWAIVFGLIRRERFVVVSQGCLDRFDRRAIEALVAHELAHHLEGHCRRDQLMRWLGRLTFTGDGFVLALQNSWGYEVGADRSAVRRLGISEPVLWQTLRRLRRVRAVLALSGNVPQHTLTTGGQAAIEVEPKRVVKPSDEDDRSCGRSFSLAWRVFVDQYFDARDLYYWHPGIRDRKRSLRTAGAEQDRVVP